MVAEFRASPKGFGQQITNRNQGKSSGRDLIDGVKVGKAKRADSGRRIGVSGLGSGECGRDGLARQTRTDRYGSDRVGRYNSRALNVC